MLTLNKIEFKNFITYKHQIFDFDEMFENGNTILICGDNEDSSFADANGVGKSIIYEGLLFALTGRNTRNTSPDSIIGKFDNHTEISVTLTLNTGFKYRIVRYRNHPEHGDWPFLYVNDDKHPVKSGTPTETTNFILKTLGLSYNKIVNTSVFCGEDSRSRFLYMGDKEQKKLLLTLIGADIFIECSKIAKQNLDEFKSDLKDIEHEIAIERSKTENLQEQISSLNELKEQFKTTKKKRLKEITKEYINEFHEIKTKIDSINKKLTNLKEQRITLKNNPPSLDKLEKLKKKFDESESQSLRLVEIKSSFASQIRTNETKLSAVISDGAVRCEYCGSTVKPTEIAKYRSEIKDKIEKFNNKYNKAATQLELVRTVGTKIKNEISAIEWEAGNYNHKLLEIKQAISHLQENLTDLFLRRKDIKLQFKTSYKRKQNEENTFDSKMSEINKRRLTIIKKIKELYTDKNLVLKKILYTEIWHNGFGNEQIQTFAIKSTVRRLNEALEENSESITDGAIDVKILTEKTLKNKNTKSVFEIQISDMHKKNLPFKEWSKGERKRIEVMTNFALMNLEQNAISEVFIDEMFDGVDETGISRLVNHLTTGDNKNKRFIVITHYEPLKRLFPNVGIVTLRNGESKFKMIGGNNG